MSLFQGYLILSALLFAVGLGGLVLKRDLVADMIAVELMLTASNIALVGFSRLSRGLNPEAEAFALFIMVSAAAEVAIGLALAILLYRRTGESRRDVLGGPEESS